MRTSTCSLVSFRSQLHLIGSFLDHFYEYLIVVIVLECIKVDGRRWDCGL
jgi:hypothetical protein